MEINDGEVVKNFFNIINEYLSNIISKREITDKEIQENISEEHNNKSDNDKYQKGKD